MAVAVIMPKQGISVESCIITKWHKAVGDAVAVDDILFEYETDKAAFEEKSTEAGTVLAILAEEGEDVPCLQNVCVIGNAGEDISAFTGAAAPAEAPVAAAPAAEAAPAPVAAAAPVANSSPAFAVIMPKQGISVESCIITKWHKAVGDAVAVDDVLFEYETDKAAFEEKSTVEGTMLALLAEEGDDVPCLQNVCVIGKPGDDISFYTGAAAAEAPAAAAPAPVAAPAAPIASTKVEGDDKVKISPRALAAAKNLGLDISLAIPTGPYGRIIERDIAELVRSGRAAKVEEAAPAPVAAAPEAPKAAAPEVKEEAAYEDRPLSGVRKAIARNMHASLSEMAQLTHHFSFDATDILAWRKKMKAAQETLGLGNITINDIVLYAAAKALKNHEDLNAHFLGDKMRYFKNVNIGMAVDTPRGLLVPTIFKADEMTLSALSAEAKSVAKAAQGGKISPDLLTGASFTVSNLGSFGVESFTPVVNPPQVAILGVCNIQYKMKADGSVYPAMGLSLTYDHRAVDGAPASRFMQELCRMLENFSVTLAL
ncbi:MAG: 2-oxo acid dehydrogenase subunit E2 [Clostridiales bacterium]|nr:2-oxo acid dehydrogenase subunit E2 [Clostridiales bacterium]